MNYVDIMKDFEILLWNMKNINKKPTREKQTENLLNKPFF